MAKSQEDNIKKLDVDTYKVSTNFFLKISIKGVELIPSIVNTIIIREYCDYIVPRLSLTIIDSGVFLDNYPLEENDDIEIQIGLDRDQSPLIATFMVECFNITNTGGGTTYGNLLEISGILKTTDLLKPNKTRSFGNIKSSDLISKIATEIGLKPDIRILSNDSMKWLQINSNTYYFLKSVLERSYVSDDDVVLSYTQSDSKMVYTTLSKEIQSKVKYEAVFDNKETLNDISESFEYNKKDGKDYIYFNDYEIINMSSIINKAEGGYGDNLVYYEDGEEITKTFSSNNHKLSTHSNRLSKDLGRVTKVDFMGTSNSRNLHGNFFNSIIQNNRNYLDFFPNMLIINIKARTDLKLLEKVNITLIGNGQEVNNVHSGEYLIGGIIYIGSSQNNLSMKLVLHRNGNNNKYSLLEPKDIKLA